MSPAVGCDESTSRVPKGVYQPPRSTDLRSPCPIVNSLANHGYIPRDGRSVRAAELKRAMCELGVSSTVRTALTYAVFLEHQDNPSTGFWTFIKNPLAYALQKFALRDAREIDLDGLPCLNLDQLGRHGAVEHDVSMSRRDFAQGDNHSPQKDLIADLISSSSSGKEITTDDLAQFRRQRLEQQRKDNPQLVFGPDEHRMACSEAAFIQKLFGDHSRGYAVPVSYMKALFEEERLPVNEGWKRRSWWYLGFIELFLQTWTLQKAVGPIE